LSHKKSIQSILNAGLLLVPGFLYALFSLSLSSNRILPEKASTHLLLLNLVQLFSFGVTIAKYAADQMILSRLNPGETANVFSFFTKRVIPIALIYSVLLYFTNGFSVACMLLLCLPVEILAIISVMEFNLSKRYKTALCLSLSGYPLLFIAYLMLSIPFDLTQNNLLMIFGSMTLIKCMLVLLLRKKNENRKDILIISEQVPLQQAGNYLLFRSDQMLIAANVPQSPSVSLFLPIDYLFYSKVVDLYSGVATSMGPLLTRQQEAGTGRISFKQLLSATPYVKMITVAILIQVALILFMIQTTDNLHLFLLFPAAISTLLIVPVNMINYEYFRTGDLKSANKNNLLCLCAGALLFFINLFVKSTILFASMVPLQLCVFVLAHYLTKKKRHV
jgi:hypothetical protein